MKYILFSVLFIFVQYALSQTMEPGLWKSKESFELAGLNLPSTNGEECVTEGQAKNAKSTIEKELKKQGCTLTKWAVKNEKLDASVTCKNADLDATGDLRGDFSKKNYDLKGEVQGKYKKALPAVAKINLTGHWVKACTQ